MGMIIILTSHGYWEDLGDNAHKALCMVPDLDGALINNHYYFAATVFPKKGSRPSYSKGLQTL